MNYASFILKTVCTASVFTALATMPLAAQQVETEITKELDYVSSDEGMMQEEIVENSFNPQSTSHERSQHIFTARSEFFDQIRLEDGSKWTVRPEHQQRLLDWMGGNQEWIKGDRLAITQAKRGIFQSQDDYKFSFYNVRTDKFIDVMCIEGPTLNSSYRRTIREFRALDGREILVLSDGTHWPLFDEYRGIWNKWQVGDSIMIGTNDTWAPWGNPDLLINITCSTEFFPAKQKK